ncbi:MAG: ferritin-like domain-containing protein [Peptococcaceae bacterium]|nr:ferritin-like domain-containing protein [Peptococcaceae bacterium]
MYYTENAYPNALRLMVEAVQGEREDELFYDYLLRMSPTEDQRQIITSIRDDERKHNRMFREIYYQLTGQDISTAPGGAFQVPGSYLEGIQRALIGELNAVVKYRQILFGLSFQPFRNMLVEIITDELRHANLWNFLYTLNVTGTASPTRPPVTEL